MEALTRLVADSLARHGFDRPVDFRRLQWSRWFHCDSQHSLLYIPSKPGVFAVAEEILGPKDDHVTTDAEVSTARIGTEAFLRSGGEGAVPRMAAEPMRHLAPAPALEPRPQRMLAVTQFFEADDMAFTLDRMLSRPNPMRARLESGRYFIRFVVIEDPLQRRTVASALNQWIVSAAEKASGLGAHFASSLELTPNTELTLGATAASAVQRGEASTVSANVGSVTPLDSGAANIHRPSVFPSGF